MCNCGGSNERASLTASGKLGPATWDGPKKGESGGEKKTGGRRSGSTKSGGGKAGASKSK